MLKNGSGSVRRKVNEVFGNTLSQQDKRTLATLIYYPREKMDQILGSPKTRMSGTASPCTALLRSASAQPANTPAQGPQGHAAGFCLHPGRAHHRKDDSVDKASYYNAIVNTIIHVGRGRECIIAMSQLIQRLVIDHLHIVGDIFDRGPRPAQDHGQAHELPLRGHPVGQPRRCGWALPQASRAALPTSSVSAPATETWDILEDGYGINLLPPCHLRLKHLQG